LKTQKEICTDLWKQFTRQYWKPDRNYSLGNRRKRSLIGTGSSFFDKQFNKSYVNNAFVSRLYLHMCIYSEWNGIYQWQSAEELSYITCKIIRTYYFFLNNQPDALIIQIYSVIKIYMFRTSSVSIIRNSVLYIRQSQDGTSWLWLETVIKNVHETYQCRMYSRELLMIGREDAETCRVL